MLLKIWDLILLVFLRQVLRYFKGKNSKVDEGLTQGIGTCLQDPDTHSCLKSIDCYFLQVQLYNISYIYFYLGYKS